MAAIDVEPEPELPLIPADPLLPVLGPLLPVPPAIEPLPEPVEPVPDELLPAVPLPDVEDPLLEAVRKRA